MATLFLNCLLHGDDPSKAFPVEIRKSINVSILKEEIQKKNSNFRLAHVDASDLILYKLITPLSLSRRTAIQSSNLTKTIKAIRFPDPQSDEALQGDGTVQLLNGVEPVSHYWENSMSKDLHILVQFPAIPGTLHTTSLLLVNCLLLGDKPSKIFTVKIAESDNVSILQNKIKDNSSPHLDHVYARDIILYKVSILDVDSHLKGQRKRIPLLPLEKMKETFPEPLQQDRIHVVFEVGPIVSEEESSNGSNRSPIPQPQQVMRLREQFCTQRPPTAPSYGARLKDFIRDQDKAPIYCNRPLDKVKTLPLSLAHPVFGKFIDDCKSHKPTPEDKIFLEIFVPTMTKMHDKEIRQQEILDLFCTIDIPLLSAKIAGTEYTMDGSIFVKGLFLYVLAELKNEIGSTHSEPYLQAVLDFLEATRRFAFQYRNSGLPCIIVLIFGPFIAFAGATWTGRPNVQMLSTAIPCHHHDSDFEMRDSLLRHIGAFRNAKVFLEQYYEELMTASPTSPLLSCNPMYPYPTSFVSGSTRNTFSYTSEFKCDHNYVFFGELDSVTDHRALCIKFTRQYGEEVHRFCASKGFAPRLHAVQRLPGGFYMVVMEDVGADYTELSSLLYNHPETVSDSAYDDLKSNIRRFLEDLHRNGWVHGDLRTTNILVKKSGLDGTFLLIDFDWSGKNQEASYPLFVNRTDVRRPDGADDAEPIVSLHDLEMLSYF